MDLTKRILLRDPIPAPSSIIAPLCMVLGTIGAVALVGAIAWWAGVK